ncbi:MAG: YbjQ family protein [Methanosphaera stadtmanae]|nr:YbjQ family protein [Methanosphaera stadtmanae]
MFNNFFLDRNRINCIFSIIMGIIVGLISAFICVYFNLAIFGINICIFISPLISGFVEIFFSKRLTNSTTGAISAIILFVITNIIGWLFPTNPIQFNIFTFGGLLVMLQAAFPLTVNYVLIGLFFLIVYVFGFIGGTIASWFTNDNIALTTTEIQEIATEENVLILTNQPDLPIKEYHGLIFVENIIEFDQKPKKEIIKYMGSTLEQKELLKQQDYIIAQNYILNSLKMKAKEINANAVIDIEIDYTNYNLHIPPDVLITVYGTAVTLDDNYFNSQ